MLVRGRDYLFFEQVHCAHPSVVETITHGAALMTPNLIAMVPWRSTGSVIVSTYGFDPVRSLRALLGDPELDIAKLDAKLYTMYADGRPRWLFPVRELERFKITTGFLGMITLKMPGESVRRVMVRDQGGKMLAKEFFTMKAQRVAAAS